ncbi:MAG: NAD(P)/FAD-dependent oxidoreductase [Lachnospiraceae bacterium]|nr:NAD(P)/FAD-dependent oxidoreductase [Lachnospiraceae bacterium]
MYKIAIIGGGPAGYSAAFETVRYGFSVLLFEMDELGGTCLNRGCIPTKYLSHVAELYSNINESKRYGIGVEPTGLDYEKTVAESENIVSKLRVDLTNNLLQSKITIVKGKAKLLDETHISCNGEVFEAEHIIIATGSKNTDKPFVHCINTDELLSLKHLPDKLIILGGGVSAVEFADIFSRLGVRIDIYIRGKRILRKWSKEIAASISSVLKKNGVKIHTEADLADIDLTSATVLSVLGRKPNLEGVDEGLVSIADNGGIVVDEYYRTKTKNIFAVGDVTENSAQLAHVAMEEAKQVVRFIAGETTKKSAVVQCIYTMPEVAVVGLSESEAKEAGIDYISAKQTMYSNARTVIGSTDRGFIKIIADKNTEKILGAELMCERASDMVGELALAINSGITVSELEGSTRAHPTFYEAVTEALAKLIRN